MMSMPFPPTGICAIKATMVRTKATTIQRSSAASAYPAISPERCETAISSRRANPVSKSRASVEAHEDAAERGRLQQDENEGTNGVYPPRS